MYKVFNQDQIIIFTENLTFCKLSDEDFHVKLTDINELLPVYQVFIKNKTHKKLIYLVDEKTNDSVDKFLSHFKLINAAGGLIKNTNNELLMIYRIGKWDLPKGKVKKKEGIRAGAIRECIEETGLENLTKIKELENTYHIYEGNNRPILKCTYWFEMKSSFDGELKPQIEEGIEQVRWMKKDEVHKAIKNTYNSLTELIENNYLNK